MEQVEASVLGTIYRNDDNGYTVLTAREGRREITIVGTLPELHPGEQAVFTGEWISHPQYGRQLKCTACTLQKPTTLLGIERYLGSGLIRGVGPSTAKMIVNYFGEDTLTILSEPVFFGKCCASPDYIFEYTFKFYGIDVHFYLPFFGI